MSKQTRMFIEQIKSDQPPTLVDTIKESASAKDLGGKLWDGLKPMFDHGRTELAAALFAGHAHVMYMKGQGQDGLGQGHAQDGPAQEGQAQEHQQQPQSIDPPQQHNQGREM